MDDQRVDNKKQGQCYQLGIRNNYHNLSLGFTTKARAYKGVSKEGSPRVTSHVHGSVGKCEGMNLHTPK